MSPTEPFSSPVTETQQKHVTIRAFTAQPVTDDLVRALINAGRRAPTSSNLQAYSVVIVRNAEVKKQLAVLAGNQRHVETCPVFLAFCADLHRLESVCAMHGVTMAKNLELTIIATVDAALVGMSVQTAAESFGLGAVMIGAMRNQPRQAADLLGLPPGVFVVYGMCLGWPDLEKIPPQKPRLPENLVVHNERYHAADPREQIAEYDEALATHYNSLARNLDPAAWSGPLARQLSQPRRPDLRSHLEQMGFVFD